ncbi:MAG: flagellin [Alicyclobacillus sp.]|nr:flagellin [Alicyclobacillus sp.]
MIINHNLGSMNALAALSKNQNALGKALQQLSTGKRINSAADDAAGLAISQKMQSQINGLDQAARNAQDGISLIQTAEGALNETENILQRMRQLAVQSANDTNNTDARTAIQDEINQLIQEVDRIRNTTQFNNLNLLDGTYSATALNLQIGANDGQILQVTISDMGASALGISGLDITSAASASAAISALDAAIKTVSEQRAELGAYQNRLEHTINNLNTASQNLTSAQSAITDTDMASAMAEFTKDNVLQQAAVSMLAQANQQPQLVLKLLG